MGRISNDFYTSIDGCYHLVNTERKKLEPEYNNMLFHVIDLYD